MGDYILCPIWILARKAGWSLTVTVRKDGVDDSAHFFFPDVLKEKWPAGSITLEEGQTMDRESVRRSIMSCSTRTSNLPPARRTTMKLNDVTRGTGLEEHGITNVNLIFWTPPTPVLYEQIVRRGEGLITHLGAVDVKTGHYTGRAASEKFIVDEPSCHDYINWGKVNQPMDPVKFNGLYNRLVAYLHGKDLFVQDCFAGASPEHRLPVRVITENAWHSLFARNMLIRATEEELIKHKPCLYGHRHTQFSRHPFL